jgi:hypothetical protein
VTDNRRVSDALIVAVPVFVVAAGAAAGPANPSR